MEYNNEEKKLEMDLRKEKYDPAMLLQHKEVKEILFNNYSDTIELPAEIENVDTLLIYVTDLKKTFIPPVNLDKLQNLKCLTLWSDFEIEKLNPMPNLENLSAIIKNTDRIKTIAEKFPNLKSLELWDSDNPNAVFPIELGNFRSLEDLELVNFNLPEFPDEITNLKALKSLCIRGTGTVPEFPEAICKLSWLEELEFEYRIIVLPEQFCNLKSLKNLNFQRAFNGGTLFPVDRWKPEKQIYLHPIPDVISKLPSLEKINLSFCGVVNLDFIKNYSKLKILDIRYSGLKNLNDLSVFKNLEELNFSNALVLENIDGISGLPIKRLILKSLRIKSIEVLSKLPLLEELNIIGCDFIKNFEPLYEHQVLKVLQADSRIVQQWNLDKAKKNLPSINLVLSDVQSGNIELFEKAIQNLKIYVDKNSSREFNPLAGYFGKEPDDLSMVNLEPLENAFLQSKSDLSIKTLLTLVDISMHSVNLDNYYITVLAIEELCRRKDVISQINVIGLFIKACEFYEFGHRMQKDTVLNRLYDDLFPAFETEALIRLLENAPADMLNCDGGDFADRCFIPAFQKVKSEEQFNTLLTIFFGYKKNNIKYLNSEYFIELQDKIKEVLIEDQLERFNENIKEDAGIDRLYALLESRDLNDYLTLINSLENLDPKFFNDKDYEIIDHINSRFTVPFDTALQIIGFYIEKEKCPYQVTDAILKYFSSKGLPFTLDYLKAKAENHTYFIDSIILEVCNQFNKNAIAIAEIEPFHEYLVESGRYDKNSLYEQELASLLYACYDHKTGRKEEQAAVYLKRIEEIALLVQGTLEIYHLSELRFKLDMVAEFSKKWEFIKRIAMTLFPIIPYKDALESLCMPIIACIKTNDKVAFDMIIKYIPEKTSDKNLSYNLACAFAHFGDKNQMLVWVKQSMMLRTTKQKFLDDRNFVNYLNDKDFNNILSNQNN